MLVCYHVNLWCELWFEIRISGVVCALETDQLYKAFDVHCSFFVKFTWRKVCTFHSQLLHSCTNSIRRRIISTILIPYKEIIIKNNIALMIQDF